MSTAKSDAAGHNIDNGVEVDYEIEHPVKESESSVPTTWYLTAYVSDEFYNTARVANYLSTAYN